METKESKKTKIILAVLSGLLVLVLAVIGFVLVSGKMKENNYTAAIKEAQKYLADHNYEQAVIQYENAISINPEEEEGYLALADIYVEQEKISKARSILRRGYEQTGSARIQRTLNDLETRTLAGRAGEEKADRQIDLATASQDIAWDTSFIQKIVSYTFDDYKREFGSVVSSEKNKDGYLEVRHSKLNATCYYRNTSDNKEIVDEGKKIPLAAGMPEKITLDSLGILFRNFDGGASLNRMQMLFGERVKPETLEGSPYIEDREEDLIARIGTDNNGNVTDSSSWNELILPLANQKKAAGGTVEGVVLDAVTGKGVANASLTFRPKEASAETVTEKTDARGVFRAKLTPADYEIEVKAQGYIAEVFTLTVEKGKTCSGEQFVISPELSGEARIVLEWGAEPLDLDSHLTGSASGGSNIHVYYASQQASFGGTKIAELDLDDTDGYGPETTTIYDLQGTYTFTVVDFQSTGTMASNGATVKVYLPGQSPVVISLDSGRGVDNVWDVCRISGGKVEVLNTAGSGRDLR